MSQIHIKPEKYGEGYTVSGGKFEDYHTENIGRALLEAKYRRRMMRKQSRKLVMA